MNKLPLQSGIIYGPVASRRLGRSLGINVLPTTHKLCSFDCLYCQYGRTRVKALRPTNETFPSVEQVLAVTEQALNTHGPLDAITFSGNGEPTLHPEFPRIVAGLRALLERAHSQTNLALLSNASTCHSPNIQACMPAIDQPILKLDAADPQTFQSLNRPANGVRLERILAGMQCIQGLIIQCMLVDGPLGNVHHVAFEAWLAALEAIRPEQVQVYSLDRPGSDPRLQRVPPTELEHLAMRASERTGLSVTAYFH